MERTVIAVSRVLEVKIWRGKIKLYRDLIYYHFKNPLCYFFQLVLVGACFHVDICLRR